MRAKDRGRRRARGDVATALLAVGLASCVLFVGVTWHGAWDPLELDALAREPRALTRWLMGAGLDRREAHALVGVAITLVAARGAALLAGRRASLVAVCVLLSMPGLVLGARTVARPLDGLLGAAMLFVATVGATAPNRRRGWLDAALAIAGASLVAGEAPWAVACACASGLVARRGTGRVVVGALAGATLLAMAAAVAHAETRSPGWARALEPAVYGALPWIALAPWVALTALRARRPRPGVVALVTWAALTPWIGDEGAWLPVGILCAATITRGPRLGPTVVLAIAASLALGLDVHRSMSGLVGASAGAPTPVDGLGEGWRYLGFVAPALLLAAAVARGRPLGLGALGAGALALGFVLAHGWVPALSARLSHAALFEALPEGGALAVFGMSPASARHFAPDAPRRLPSSAASLAFLDAREPRYAVVPERELCAVRQRARAERRALFVVGSDPRFFLLSNRRGERDHDPLRGAIGDRPPAHVGRPVTARLRHLDLLGVRLPASAARGATVEATLHLRVREPIGRDMRVLVHVDGPGPRFQGDHDPVGGACPTSRWLPGDYVDDRFSFAAGTITHPPGRYSVYVGLYWGSPGRWSNLEVLDGPGDRFDRVFAGELELR